ncbi:MAG TPA: PKD domain-containing protein, partial [Ornithinibacter sp.]|nr:PKD domain-containing protein [Ornithinibacter sp.]
MPTTGALRGKAPKSDDIRRTPVAHPRNQPAGRPPSAPATPRRFLLAVVLLVSFLWAGTAQAAPGNDDRVNAVAVTGVGSITFAQPIVGSTLGATKEAGEPDHAGEPGGASVWYRFVGPPSGVPVTFETVGSGFDTVLAVYRCDAWCAIAETVTSDNDSAGGGASRVSFVPAPQTGYLIAVDGVGGASGALRLTAYLTPPANDDFAQATQITGSAGRASGLNIGATTETGEPLHDATPQYPSHSSVWWRWTAPANGPVTFDPSQSEPVCCGFGNNFTPNMAIYTGVSVGSLTPVQVTRTALAQTFTATAGTTYSIATAVMTPLAPGRVVLQWGTTPANERPAVAAGADGTVPEGTSFTRSGSFTDPGSATWSATVDYGEGSGSQALPLDANGAFQLTRTYADDGTRTVTVAVTDDQGAVGTDTLDVTVTNVAPTVGPVAVPSSPTPTGTNVGASASFTDPGTADTHAAVWEWGDGTTSVGSISGGSAAGSHTYAVAGVYTVTLTVTDDDGGAGTSVSQYLVVYDPDGGFVTGGGWIDSPAGAYAADPSLTGRASFGFVSRYQKGATAPSGETQFNFKVAGLSFHSTSYDFLVVSGSRAMYKGTGTVNGRGDYGFMLSAVDGQVAGGGGVDRFRI